MNGFPRVLATTFLLLFSTVTMSEPRPQQPKTMVLVGASIGAAWKLPDLSKRILVPGYEFDYVGTFAFDKTPLISALTSRPRKPDAVLIKECSTYFPGNHSRQIQQIELWVQQLRDAGIQPILVTTAPPGEPAGLLDRLKNLVKHVIGRPTILDGVTIFNDWLKQYAREEKIPIFDLEAALHRGTVDRWLKPEFDSGDQIHLNQQAYDTVDRAFVRFLETLPQPVLQK